MKLINDSVNKTRPTMTRQQQQQQQQHRRQKNNHNIHHSGDHRRPLSSNIISVSLQCLLLLIACTNFVDTVNGFLMPSFSIKNHLRICHKLQQSSSVSSCCTSNIRMTRLQEDEELNNNNSNDKEGHDDDDDDEEEESMMFEVADFRGRPAGVVIEDLNWRVEKLRLEEANTRRFLKAGPRFLPYSECCKWVQAWGQRWSSSKEWYAFVLYCYCFVMFGIDIILSSDLICWHLYFF